MTTVEAAARIGIQPHKVSEYCKRGIIDCTWRPRGRQAREYDISEAQLARYLAARTASTRSTRSKALWARRRYLTFERGQKRIGHLPTMDDVNVHERRMAALARDPDEVDVLKERGHVRWWWNRTKGVIVGQVDLDDIAQYAARVWAARPAAAPVPAYIPGEWRS